MTFYLIMKLGELRTSLKAHFLSLDSKKKNPLFNKHTASLGNNMQNFKIAHTTKYRDIWLLERISEYSSNVTPIAHQPIQERRLALSEVAVFSIPVPRVKGSRLSNL